MSQEKQIPETSREAEERYLQGTLEVVRRNMSEYGREVSKMKADIDEMLEHYHDDDPEVFTILNNTITLHDHMKRALERNEKAAGKPYFGRIVFHDKALDREESIYIGKGGIAENATRQVVTDWRAPVANAYYENGLGECSYAAPDGVQMEIDLKLKRTYEIDQGKLLDFYDTEVVANDELLTKYLARNKEAVLGEIIATIQKEQNDIIRKSPYHNIIVQGVAGSGKTTVAMHRISFILYNYQERFRPEDFYIVGSNRILLNYITGVLPDLDVHGVRQMTMEQLFVRLLYEDWDEKKYRIRAAESSASAAASGSTGKENVKGTLEWFRDLEEYCRRLEWSVIPRESILLNRKQFVEGIREGKTGVFDRTVEEPAGPMDLINLFPGDAIEEYIRQNPSVSVQNKINMLNERLLIRVQDEFLGKNVTYTESERKAILRACRGRFGKRVWKQSIYDLYQDFLAQQHQKGDERGSERGSLKGELDVYDLAALAYIYKRVKETEVISEAHHVVIDEAQDFGMMVYSVLKFCIKDCTYTIMGDVSQNIHFGYGLSDWEELRRVMLPDEKDCFGLLKKSYRNTVEISEFAANILRHGHFSIYPAEPIIRHGNPVQIQEIRDRKAMLPKTAAVCRQWQEKGLDTIAVICRNRESAEKTADGLAPYIEVTGKDLEKAVFEKGVMVLPVEYTKGLEFDAVLILDPVREEYPVDDGHAKLLYVAATRALHELCIIHGGNLTGLIADPVPKRNREDRHSPQEEMMAEGTRRPSGEGEKEASKRNAAGSKQERRKRIVIPSLSSSESSGPEAGGGQNGGRKAFGEKDAKSPGELSMRYRLGSQPAGAGRRYSIAAAEQPAVAARPERKRFTAAIGPDGKHSEENTGKLKTAWARDDISFGDMPVTEKLRLPGHGKIDLSVRWAVREPDGFCIQSRYGMLRISPVNSRIVRVTFAKEQRFMTGYHRGITLHREDRTWMYREAGGNLEVLTDDLCIQVNRLTGSIRYLTRDRELLLAEREKESRQMEAGSAWGTRIWLFPEWAKGEKIYGMGGQGRRGMNLRGLARYISHGKNSRELPLLISDRGYGILLAPKESAVFCDVPAYGSWICTENDNCMDFYFIAGKGQKEIVNSCVLLCGEKQ